MAKSNDFFKQRAIFEDNRFYGEGNKVKVTNQYFRIKHVLDDDTIILNTRNVRLIKGQPVMFVDNNKGVYLKDWQIKKAHNFDMGIDTFLVKLSRQWFRPYEFKFSIEDFGFEHEQDFDFLLGIAREQDEEGMTLANGFMG